MIARGWVMRRSAYTCDCQDPDECECASLADDAPSFLIVWIVGAVLVGMALMVLLAWLLIA